MVEYSMVPVTPDDYRNFRKAYSMIRYSFFEGDENQMAVDLACKFATETATRSKAEFLKDVESPNREMYFFTVNGENQGFCELIFKDKECEIFEFAVFKQKEGMGSILLREVQKIIKERNCVKIVLFCPFKGAQVFWKKKGFKPIYIQGQLLFRSKVR